MKKLLFIFGTRPEAIKMIPIYKKFKESNLFDVKICITAQHREMLDDVMEFFEIKADYDLDLMKKNQTLEELSSNVLNKVSNILNNEKFDLVFVHGDTTTSFFSALAAFYSKIDVAHIEAGLRTYEIYSPYPEELNRQCTARIAKYHFVPTEKSKQNLLNESVNFKNIYVVGNSVIDALFLTLKKLPNPQIQNPKPYILITAHRRENFGEGFLNICNAIKELAIKYKNYDFIYPVHLNPNVREPVFKILSDLSNVKLIEPVNYPKFVQLMANSYLILTDSGGIQEEAPSLKKPVLVMRSTTERPEALNAGMIKLVDTNKEKIVQEVSQLIENKDEYNQMIKGTNPYGDGKTNEKIFKIIKDRLR